MARAVSLALVLFGLWLLLSGHLEPWLVALGAVSAVVVRVLASRMDAADHERRHLGLTPRLLAYWPWLAWQVLVSNVDVARRVLSPRLAIGPRVIRLRATQHTDIGRVTYANSITLTPGTVTIDVEGDEITVHALTAEAAETLQTGAMDRRVSALEPRR